MLILAIKTYFKKQKDSNDWSGINSLKLEYILYENHFCDFIKRIILILTSIGIQRIPLQKISMEI